MDDLKVRNLSTIIRDQDPLKLPPATTVREACRRMYERRVGAVLVAEDDGQLVGIFTGRDAVGRVLAEGRDPTTLTLAEVMTADPDCIAPGRTAVDALQLMQDGGFRHVPIVEGRRVVGVVSHGDFRGCERTTLDEQTGLWERI